MAVVSRVFETEAVASTSISLIGLGVVIGLLYWARVFFITLLTAIIIAFILEPFVRLLIRARLPRGLASFVVCSLAMLIVYLVGLGAYRQIADLVENLPQYSQRIGEAIERGRRQIENIEKATYNLIMPARKEAPPPVSSRQKRKRPEAAATQAAPAIPEVRIHPERTPLVEFFYSRLGSLYQTVLMASFVPFLVYFMLSWREHIQRNFLHFFDAEHRVMVSKSLQGIAEMVRAFVVGNFMLGMLLAAASCLTFWKLGLPYALLIGPLSGFLSLVPYVGLPLALIPPMFFALAVFNSIGAYVIVAVIVTLFHLLALNLLYPKLVGSRVHLNPLVVTVALMFFGFLWDAAGLVLAIPLTAAIKAVCDNVKGLRLYGRFLGD